MAVNLCPLRRHCPGRPMATATTLLNMANFWWPVWKTFVMMEDTNRTFFSLEGGTKLLVINYWGQLNNF